MFHTIVSIKNDGHYFCRAGGNRPDGLNEPVTFFMLLYDMENLDKFIKELMDINVQSEDSKEKGKSRKERMLEYINSYIRNVYGRFLCTSKERYEQHKRKNSSKKKNGSGGTH
ncbi:hypothetical protein F9430_25370 [Escherichia coli]|nr:hypothetical protein [Escherichia coli]